MISIDMLFDDVLLEIFDIYMNENEDSDEDLDDEDFKAEVEKWQTLVHVCRRWRSIVFGSPRRLNLRLVCIQGTPARDALDVWPSLPLVIQDTFDHPTEGVDDIVAVLERGKDRVVEIYLIKFDNSEFETLLAAMQVPFPELKVLVLISEGGMESVLPDSFVGGSAPRLETLALSRIPFPGIPKLLLSTTHLVTLRLEIPHSGYISPEAMVTALSTLTSLGCLSLQFESPRSRPDWANRHLPLPTRSFLPVLNKIRFKGVCEYLEDLVVCIDAPRLDEVEITFFNQIVFDTSQFIQFISRTPTLETFEKAHVFFDYGDARVNLSSQTPGHGKLNVKIPCNGQISSMEKVCTSCLPPLSMLEDLYIYEPPFLHPDWVRNIENSLWLGILQPFSSVKNLYLCKRIVSRIMPALQELVGGRTTEVLPTLQNIFLEDFRPSTVQAGIQQFVAMRQVTNHPIALSCWDNSKEDMAKYSY